jgi:hypothetical protein
MESIYSKDKTNYGLDKEKFSGYFNEYGFDVEYIKFRDVNFRRLNFKGEYVLYQSSEDIGLKYKSYIEDILLGLLEQGAILIPEFKYFRAHHNKVYAEILRDTSEIESIKNINSKYFGTYEEYADCIEKVEDNTVFKTSEGALSSGVRLLKNQNDKFIIPKFLSETKPYKSITLQLKDKVRPLTNIVKRILGIKVYYEWQSNYREKFILQNYIPDLKGDFKVLVFGDKYYFLERSVRPDDFRASGSGNYFWPDKPNNQILNFAKELYRLFNCPLASFDIALDKNELYLLEFQFIMFGTITLERSKYYYHFDEKNMLWVKVEEEPDLERETARAISDWILGVRC